LDIRRLATEIEEEIIAFRRQIHRYPELSSEEFMTTKLIEEKLKENNIEYSKTDLESGVIAIIRGERDGKTIALRADIDALPIHEESNLEFASKNDGVMHACGHDIHTAVLMGALLVLNKFKKDIAGNIKFFFQPAEEKIGGAKMFIEAGALKSPEVDAVIGFHTWPDLDSGTIGYKKGAFLASTDELFIDVFGRGGHAAHPDQCVDPILISAHILTKLQSIISRELSPTDSAVVTVGTINAGIASNVIPSSVEMTGTVRTVNKQTHKNIFDKIRRIVSGTAESMGGNVDIRFKKGTPPLVCDSNLVEVIKNSAAELLGQDKLIELKKPSMGGDDFSFYTEKVPGAFFRLGTANEDDNSRLSLHNSKIIFDERSIQTGIKVLSKITLDYLSNN